MQFTLAGTTDLRCEWLTGEPGAGELARPVRRGAVGKGPGDRNLAGRLPYTENWLKHLLALASKSSALGLVGPMSNYASPPQLVETVPYRLGPRAGARGSAL